MLEDDMRMGGVYWAPTGESEFPTEAAAVTDPAAAPRAIT